MTVLSIGLALLAALFLAGGGYLFGVRRGRLARELLRERLSQPQGGDDTLRAAVEKLLEPLVEREKTKIELSSLTSESRDFAILLDEIANKGGFSAVLLADDSGLPLATSSKSTAPERLAGIAALILLVSDRLQRLEGPGPVAFLIQDEAHQSTLTRFFEVRGQTLMLAAVSSNSQLSASALDPALGALESALGR